MIQNYLFNPARTHILFRFSNARRKASPYIFRILIGVIIKNLSLPHAGITVYKCSYSLNDNYH